MGLTTQRMRRQAQASLLRSLGSQGEEEREEGKSPPAKRGARKPGAESEGGN